MKKIQTLNNSNIHINKYFTHKCRFAKSQFHPKFSRWVGYLCLAQNKIHSSLLALFLYFGNLVSKSSLTVCH